MMKTHSQSTILDDPGSNITDNSFTTFGLNHMQRGEQNSVEVRSIRKVPNRVRFKSNSFDESTDEKCGNARDEPRRKIQS
jgi:hypothetical protein